MDSNSRTSAEPLLSASATERTPLRRTIFIVIPVFAGYAALFSLQRPLRLKFDTCPNGWQAERNNCITALTTKGVCPSGSTIMSPNGADNDFCTAKASSMTGSSFDATFQLGVSMLYIGNLIFRIGHNIFFSCLIPRQRVFVSAIAMSVSMSVLASLTAGTTANSRAKSDVWKVFFAYFVGGIGLGSFEANMIQTVTPFGDQTKVWTIAGMPIGVMVITIGGFLLLQVDGSDPAPIFVGVIVALFSTVGLLLTLPQPQAMSTKNDGSANNLRLSMTSFPSDTEMGLHLSDSLRGSSMGKGSDTGGHGEHGVHEGAVKGKHAPISITVFRAHLREWRQWLPHIKWHVIAMSFNMFCVAISIPLTGYLYAGIGPAKHVPWSYQPHGAAAVAAAARQCGSDCPGIEHDYFMVIFNLCFSLGDMSSRKLLFPGTRLPCLTGAVVPSIHPAWFPVLFSCSGFAMIMSRFAPLVPVGGFLIAFGNGSLYGQTCWFVEHTLPARYELVALSVWLFVGDWGSVIGTNLVPTLSAGA